MAPYKRLQEAEEELAEIKAYDDALPEAAAASKRGDFLTLAEFEARHCKIRA